MGMKLTKEEWEHLDSLLGKLGFGGYYDLMELLRQTASNLTERFLPSEEQPKMNEQIMNEKDLKTLVTLVNYLSRVVYPSKGR